MTRYKCLVLDHDDTAVSSTAQIHYPSFCESLRRLRPEISISLEEFYELSFDRGVGAMCRDVLGLSERELESMFEDWKYYVNSHVPDFFPGIPELVCRQKSEGGYVCVVSHSLDEIITRDYALNCGIQPDLVFGWEQGEGRRKPSPWPLQEAMRRLELMPKDLLVVDDLKPGFDMARACGVDFAYAGWSALSARVTGMRERCDYFLHSPAELSTLLFSD